MTSRTCCNAIGHNGEMAFRFFGPGRPDAAQTQRRHHRSGRRCVIPPRDPDVSHLGLPAARELILPGGKRKIDRSCRRRSNLVAPATAWSRGTSRTDLIQLAAGQWRVSDVAVSTPIKQMREQRP
jgi:hypothetical protein